MYNLFKFIVIVALSIFSITASAKDFKVGILDMHVLLQDSPQAKKSAKKLESKFSKRRDEIITKEKDLKKKYKNFERDKSINSREQNTKTERLLSRLNQELHLLQQEYQSDYVAAERAEMKIFMDIVKETIDKFAKDNNYQLILTKQSTAFAANSIEITKHILTLLKK